MAMSGLMPLQLLTTMTLKPATAAYSTEQTAMTLESAAAAFSPKQRLVDTAPSARTPMTAAARPCLRRRRRAPAARSCAPAMMPAVPQSAPPALRLRNAAPYDAGFDINNFCIIGRRPAHFAEGARGMLVSTSKGWGEDAGMRGACRCLGL